MWKPLCTRDRYRLIAPKQWGKEASIKHTVVALHFRSESLYVLRSKTRFPYCSLVRFPVIHSCRGYRFGFLTLELSLKITPMPQLQHLEDRAFISEYLLLIGCFLHSYKALHHSPVSPWVAFSSQTTSWSEIAFYLLTSESVLLPFY